MSERRRVKAGGRRLGLVGVVVGAVACVPVLVLSAWPGLWETALPWLIAVGVVGGGPLAAGAVTAWWLFGRPAWRRPLGGVLVVAVLSCALLVIRAPRRVVFAAARAPFVRAVQAPPPPGSIVRVDEDWGGFHVLDWASDERGGVYFRTYRGGDGPDLCSGGFAFEANAEGTPFGSSDLRRGVLFGGWSSFVVTDDYGR